MLSYVTLAQGLVRVVSPLPIHACARGCLSVLFIPSLYFFLKSFFHLFLILAMVPDENSMEDPLCNSSFGSMVSLDCVTPDTENKVEVAARRLDRMEREQTEADDAEHEANLQEALANQSKAVKVVVDKWFVDKARASEKPRKAKSSSSTLAPCRVPKYSRSALMRGCRW